MHLISIQISDGVNGTLKSWYRKFVPEPVQLLLKRVRSAKYRGNRVRCIFCQSTYREFVPHGLAKRTNARCPTCGSLERHRLMWKYMQERTDFLKRKSLKMLHFAPEKILLKVFSTTPGVAYFPCDLVPEKYDNISRRVKIHKVDITAIPFPGDYFDVIICSHVLEHIPDDAKAMAELHRVMKPDGWGIFQVPINPKLEVTLEDPSIATPEQRKIFYGKEDHVRYYGKDYVQRLTNAGFLVTADEFVKSFSQEEAFSFGFDVGEIIFFCRKAGVAGISSHINDAKS